MTRSQAKARTRSRLVVAARRTVQEQGAAALSLREVARTAGIVPSAVYRHFDSRDALLTALILDAYTGLAETLEAAVSGSETSGEATSDTAVSGDSAATAREAVTGSAGWRLAAHAMRSWALGHRHEFLLIYGTPVPGYAAPTETIAAATRVAEVFIARARADALPGRDDALREQLREPAEEFTLGPDRLAHAFTDIAQLIGLLILELGGHFVGSADPADLLWAHVVEGQVARIDR